MKVFLDDLRDTPSGWVRVYWPREAIVERLVLGDKARGFEGSADLLYSTPALPSEGETLAECFKEHLDRLVKTDNQRLEAGVNLDGEWKLYSVEFKDKNLFYWIDQKPITPEQHNQKKYKNILDTISIRPFFFRGWRLESIIPVIK